MELVGTVVLIQLFARYLVFNIAGVPRASAVFSAGSFPLHPLHSLIWMNGLDVVGLSNVPADDTFSLIPPGGQGVLCTHSQLGVGVCHFVPLVCVALSGPRLPCNTVRACVPSQLAFAVLCSLSFGKFTARFQTGTEKARGFTVAGP